MMESPLLDGELCNLGSINLTRFIRDGSIDYDSLSDVIRLAIRFLDNVIDANTYPLEITRIMSKGNRKVGLGIMGWADLLSLLRIPYNSNNAVKLADEVTKHISTVAKDESVEIAKVKGVFPNFTGSIYDTGKDEDRVRNATRTSIAPNGTLSMIAGCNGGIEPYFLLAYSRGSMYDSSGKATLTTVIRSDTLVRLLDEEGIELSNDDWDKICSSGRVDGVLPKSVAKLFPVANDISYTWHLKMQSAMQKNVDLGISKTVNLPSTATGKDVLDTYTLAYKLGNIKGVTIYRDGCKDNQVMQGTTVVAAPNLPILTNGDRPKKLYGWTEEISTPVGTLFMTVNTHDNIPIEVLLTIGKAGSDVTADAESIGRLISLLLKYKVPVESIVKQLRGIGGSSSTGYGKGRVKSLADAVAKVLEINFLSTDSKDDEPIPKGKSTGNLCPDCGVVLVEAEGCIKCPNCGYSKC